LWGWGVRKSREYSCFAIREDPVEVPSQGGRGGGGQRRKRVLGHRVVRQNERKRRWPRRTARLVSGVVSIEETNAGGEVAGCVKHRKDKKEGEPAQYSGN